MNRFDNPRNLTLLLVLLALSTVIDGLDASIVNVALPTLSKEMEVSLGDTSWVTLTYIISIAALLLPAARLATLFGNSLGPSTIRKPPLRCL